MIQILIVLLITISGVCSGIMDSIQFYDPFSKSKFWSKSAWVNKYKNGSVHAGPRFPGSTTIFVWLTDGWHLCKAIHIHSILLSIILSPFAHIKFGIPHYLFFYVVLRLWFHAGFTLAFNLSK